MLNNVLQPAGEETSFKKTVVTLMCKAIMACTAQSCPPVPSRYEGVPGGGGRIRGDGMGDLI